jgi:hypothetical protein
VQLEECSAHCQAVIAHNGPLAAKAHHYDGLAYMRLAANSAFMKLLSIPSCDFKFSFFSRFFFILSSKQTRDILIE